MTLLDIISLDSIIVGLESDSKEAIIEELVGCLQIGTALTDREKVLQAVLDREKIMSTGIGDGIAIPHGKLPNLDRLHGFFARLNQPIDFQAIDERPVDLIFVLLAPETAGADHLKALARISRLLRDQAVCEKLRGTDGAEALYAILIESEEDRAA